MKNDNAHWIASGAQWISKAGCRDESNLYLEFARRFDCAAPNALTLDITAVTQYRAAVNDRVIGRGPAVSDRSLYYFDRYTLGPDLLRRGTNLLTVLLFHDGRCTETTQGFEYGEPGLLAHLYGEGAALVSDASWRVRRAPVYAPCASMVSKWGSYKEYYHGEREDDWQSPAFDHSSWEAAVEAAEAVSPGFVQNLVLLDLPPLEAFDVAPQRIIDVSANLGDVQLAGPDVPAPYTGQPITVAPGEPGAMPSVTFDFGRMVVGYPEIKIEAAGAGCIYEVWYGETLEMARLDVVRPPARGVWRAFQRRAFRFLKVSFIALEGPVTLERVIQHNVWYAYDARGAMTGSDARINRMIEVSKYTVRANSSYHYEDCPVREQALWVLDTRLMAWINAYHFGSPALTEKCIRQHFALQRADGSVAACGPKQNAMFHLDYCLHLAAALREYYQYTGDVAFVRELYPYLRKLHGFIKSFQDTDGLLDSDRQDRTPPFLDWSFHIEKAGKTTILNAFYKRYLEDVSALAGLCGDAALAESAVQEAAVVKDAINARLFDVEARLYRDAWRAGAPLPIISQQANMAAIYADVAPPEAVELILARVWDAGAYPRPFAPAFYFIVFEALARAGRYDAIWRTLHDYWGAMLDRGARTWWEVFDPGAPAWAYPHTFLGNTPTYELDWIPVSTCHGWSGIPAYAVPRYLLGVDLSQLYRDTITIEPGLPGLFEKMDYTLPVRGGLLRLAYRGDGARYEIDVLERPAGVELVL
ncbi:MAG: hypothetical protein JXB47_10175 [Anaerolineae bacterium]|nr:hypothetical protein [Anaerolineae bacterium]